ncbi:ribonuclease E inhibitor RraA/Dimethylmenaquinone methyltransferase [Aspergillus spinulosporus]
MPGTTPADIIKRLQQWGACDVKSTEILPLTKVTFLTRLGCRRALQAKVPQRGLPGGTHPLLSEFQAGDTKIVGQAFTVKFVSKTDEAAPKLSGNYIDMIPKGAVVFISQPPPQVNAIYGGLMTLRAQVLGAAGVVIDGRVRDLSEHRALNFPLFAKAVGTTAGGEVCRPSEVNVPVRLHSDHQDAWIRPGDYIIGDLNGVVRLPQELAEQVLEDIPAIAEADAKCAEGIKAGRVVQEVFKAFRGR